MPLTTTPPNHTDRLCAVAYLHAFPFFFCIASIAIDRNKSNSSLSSLSSDVKVLSSSPLRSTATRGSGRGARRPARTVMMDASLSSACRFNYCPLSCIKITGAIKSFSADMAKALPLHEVVRVSVYNDEFIMPAWNNLPSPLCRVYSVRTFRRLLKTCLFAPASYVSSFYF